MTEAVLSDRRATSATPDSVRRATAWLWLAPIGLRLGVLAWEHVRGQAVLDYVRFSDASSFLGVAHALLDPARVETLTHYDTRVFPLWPAMEALLLALRLPEAALLFVPILLSGAVSHLFFRATGNFRAALLLGLFPPVWLLSTVHPLSEAFYLTLGIGAALAWQRERLFWAGLLVGLMVATRPFGIAWVGALVALMLLRRDTLDQTAAGLRVVTGVACGGAVLVALNLHLYGDVLHQVRVYSGDLSGLNLGAETARALGDSAGHWGPPFWHVLSTPWKVATPAWKIVYVYAHVLALLALAPVALRRCWQQHADAASRAENFLLLAFVFNGALIVCTGPYWGFHSFDRYFLWGAPGALLAFAALVPSVAWRWVLAFGGLGSTMAALFALQRLHP